MRKKNHCSDIASIEAIVVYKHSRFTYAMERGALHEKDRHSDEGSFIIKELIAAHEQNLLCIEKVRETLDDLRIKYHLKCRSDITEDDLLNRFVISVGGDGTVLDISHYCKDSPILGVNSDPNSSIGALCVANVANLHEILRDVYEKALLPTPLTRLAISVAKKPQKLLALNDVLFCNKNPAAMSRFIVTFQGITESHRSSGMWVASAAGSTGGIFSSGAEALSLDSEQGVFRSREPYWVNTESPKLLKGIINPEEKFVIHSNMTDAQIFVDGPHKIIDIDLGESVELSLSDQPLWLFDGKRLIKNRDRIIKQREAIRDKMHEKLK